MNWRDVTGIAFLTIALLVMIALLSFNPDDPPNGSGPEVANRLGPGGAYVADFIVHYTFGRYIALIIPLLFGLMGVDLLFGRGMLLTRRFGRPMVSLGFLGSTAWGVIRDLAKLSESWELTGIIGGGISQLLLGLLGRAGAIIIMVGAALIYFTLLLKIRWVELFDISRLGLLWLVEQISGIRFKPPDLQRGLEKLREAFAPAEFPETKPKRKIRKPRSARVGGGEMDRTLRKEELAVAQDAAATELIRKKMPKAVRVKPGEAESAKPGDPSAFELPPVNILDESEIVDADDLIEEKTLRLQAALLEERLAEFGVDAQIVQINPGPVITRYDLKPAPGVKVGQIKSLDNDLALTLSAARVRILAPIPGVGAVGIEVPNPTPHIVKLGEIAASKQFTKADSPLAIALGKTADGEVFVADLATMPHLLIAGTTGSGKSVCINTIIASLLLRNRPDEVVFAMIDPKKLELSIYSELRRHHLLFIEEIDEVIATTPKSAVAMLTSIVNEMEKRYDILAESGARGIAEFNRMLQKDKVRPDENGTLPSKMPYIVVIVDELADLMLTAARDAEEPITRLAQMARAVGIHLVLATQRPSVDVITGLIKANFPARIAFMVRQNVDSRTIIDRPGAETLLGNGDGLFLASDSPQEIRFHCALVTTEEIHRLVAHVARQPAFVKPVTLELPAAAGGEGGGIDTFGDGRDTLFCEAVRIVIHHQQASVSLLQRRLKVGYSRAGRILDQLEQAGIVGPFEGSKAREVTILPDDLEVFLDDIGCS